MSAEFFYQSYRNKGFNFSKKLLTRYCLSLYTKPFVLLSGISGTGKTKIAQLFEAPDRRVAQLVPVISAPAGGYILFKITDQMLAGERVNLKSSDIPHLFEPDDLVKIKASEEAHIARDSDGNYSDDFPFTISSDQGSFQVGIYLQRASNPLVRVRMKSRRGEKPAYDNATSFLKKHYKVGDVLKLEKTAPRQLRVASVNERPMVQINQQLELQEEKLVTNKLFVAVKSNWTDSTELFGHYNIFDEKYHCTPLLKFVLTARQFPDKPFFLLLDEMNLSRVEHYFSDFLSCLESRYIDGAELKQEKIQLHNISRGAESNDDEFDQIPASIAIPPNLYVTGTVNIDETTYMFSPKVLDRANVIEFNEVSLDTYNSSADNGERFVLSDFPKFGKSVVASSAAFAAAPEKFKTVVNDLLGILQPFNLHFGYRVINEMALFMQHTAGFIGQGNDIITDAIDIQLVQKVLPKFNGAFGKLDKPLRSLIAYLQNDDSIKPEDVTIERLDAIAAGGTAYPETLKKLIAMYRSLAVNGFASYLE